MANINKIKLSGTTYNIQDLNASKTVELTQAQYDALTVKDPNTFYVITDAQGADLSNYYTKSETSGATEISTALNAKADTLVSGTNIKTINNQSILGSGNIDIQGGGSSKELSAGTNISITTGETADTINCTLPITFTDGFRQHLQVYYNDNNWNYAAAQGFIIGSRNNITGNAAFISGDYNNVKGNQSAVFGYGNTCNNLRNFAFGEYLNVDTNDSFASGKYNVSNTGSTESGKTIFSVGNGTSSARHNAFEIRQNGDIYIADTNDTTYQNYYEKPMIKLQDALVGLKLVKLTQSEYDALSTKDDNTVYFIGDSTNGYTMKIGSANVN